MVCMSKDNSLPCDSCGDDLLRKDIHKLPKSCCVVSIRETLPRFMDLQTEIIDEIEQKRELLNMIEEKISHWNKAIGKDNKFRETDEEVKNLLIAIASRPTKESCSQCGNKNYGRKGNNQFYCKECGNTWDIPWN